MRSLFLFCVFLAFLYEKTVRVSRTVFVYFYAIINPSK